MTINFSCEISPNNNNNVATEIFCLEEKIHCFFFPVSYSPESGVQKKNQNYRKIRGATTRIFIFILFLRKSVWKSDFSLN